MRIYLLEPYLTGSHRAWAEGLARHSRHEIRLVSHEGQFWKWRLTGGAVTMAEEYAAAVTTHGPADALLSTSMLDLAAFLGLAGEAASGIPILLYMHENQITYPATGRTRAEDRLGLTTWTSLLAADAVAFNSDYHRDVVLEALPAFLGGFPDRRHGHLVGHVAERCTVLPVGVDLTGIGGPDSDSSEGPPLILWNHRWDPDKDPAEFLAAVGALADDGAAFQVALAGERFAKQAEEHREAIDRLGPRVVVNRYLAHGAYVALLRRADIVISTALQEFFGVSVVEAMAAGSFPLLPDRLVYRERIPSDLHKRCLYRSRSELVAALGRAIHRPNETARIGSRLALEAAVFDWPQVIPAYDDWLEGSPVIASP